MYPRPYFCLVALFCLPLVLPANLQSAEPAPGPRLDRGKGRIEIPLKLTIAAATATAAKPALKEARKPAAAQPLTAKKTIENPVKFVVAKTQPVASKPTINDVPKPAAAPQPTGKRIIENPIKVVVAKTLPVAGKPTLAAAKPQPEPAPKKNRDRGKYDIEEPVETLIAGKAESAASGVAVEPPKPQPPSAKFSETKAKIEAPAKTVVRTASPRTDKPTVATATAPVTAPAAAHPQLKEKVAASSDEDNPRVEPGKVRWHDDFAAACSASSDSGKPVLLFHLMGRLDQRFT